MPKRYVIPMYEKIYFPEFQSFPTSSSFGKSILKMALPPYISEKKISLDYRVHGIQIDRLGLTVSTQKSVLKNMQPVPRYHQKSVKNWPSKPNQQNLTHFGRYLGTRCIFFKTDFCIETVSLSRSI